MTAVLPERTRPLAAPAPHDLLERLAAAPGGRTAVIAADHELTFDELRTGAMRIAAGLAAHGVGPESVVALCLPRGAALVTALIGTLTAGAAYLPVDPKLPAERRRYLVTDSGADAVITLDGGPDGALPAGVPRLGLAELLSGDAPGPGYRPVPVTADTLAYVIYTSGSTGRPKGVEIARGAAARLLTELEDTGIATGDGARVGWNASPSFDASVQQWVRVCRGDTLVMVDDETRADPALLAAFTDEQSLTDLDLTPSHAEPLLDLLSADGGPRPLTLLIGGEAIGPALWSRIAELTAAGTVRAVNLYGPTECTVDATAGWIEPAGRTPHIGGVLPGLRMRVLDEKLAPVGTEGTGELYLAGPRVGRGYRNRPGLTAERFTADTGPDAEPGGRMYRTGDLVRLLPDGRLDCLGRADGQVKLRGFRIELPEIEAAMTAHGSVTEAVAVLRDDVHGAPGIVGYYRAAAPVTETALTELLAASLPAYMVPSVLVAVDRFPTTVNGKLDRAALPAPPSGAPAPAVADSGLSASERLIGDVWTTVLRASSVGPDDNFFKLGGHSLLAIKLVSRVRSELGVALPVKAVYAHPRLRDLAAHIDGLVAAQDG
ncbi:MULTISPECIES: non-ribosomal peptide synthetase [Streptomyces]|uniref:Amino acid adenylation domain-containing protein n=1 Tax=Streptomyces tsukubensis (strain DSM 42081 / NBRC 108919 / NRRL 18488 / 9993) TaxID=1114943 RepID=I2MUE9_STRT9|nr:MULTISPECIES: non-ribosomal peptide synthetase [Streptomyces]AZK92921.1 thioester reductase [Streptomyces tsukubensis]EIF88396.1 amino acid adenylation domain-containing protein [Streptomyces tsukubensis NRRL18488]MYS63269.1 amino acid adenylation domain-containing protein [Streptomyces sp. SID5473]QKM70917.1 amino acid adenylation domain-containing protein [Streptomyces tsukubensis NRRL18488]TAI40967.1 amino acid adenylation domain-containing protein [Streptomyces tsukubensis]